MSCGHDDFTNDCVCSTLLAVAEAQEKVEEDCRSGCQQAIDELNGRMKIRGFDTIPVMLTCNCNPFSAVGAFRSNCGNKVFHVFKSFLFRVSEVDEETCCATLELLKPITFDREHEESSSESSKHHHSHDGCGTPFDKFLRDVEHAKKFARTGMCVTVDLKAFTSVTCFPPINAI